MRRKSRKKSRRNAGGGGSVLGSIIALPFVLVVSIIKLPFVAIAALSRAFGSILGTVVRLPFAAIGLVWRLIASIFGVLIRIPVASIATGLFSGVATVSRSLTSVFAKLIRVQTIPRGGAPILLVLGVIGLVAAYPELNVGIASVVALIAGAMLWTTIGPSSIRVTSKPTFDGFNSRDSLKPRPQDLDEIYSLTPREFEVFVRNLLTDLGYMNLTVVGGAGDLGVDIFGHDTQGRSVAVQCKRYSPSQRIGSPVIQTFIGMQKIQHRADKGIFVTTASFTLAAQDLAEQHDIWLIDGGALVDLHYRR